MDEKIQSIKKMASKSVKDLGLLAKKDKVQDKIVAKAKKMKSKC
jgi:hypothetical protein